MADLRVDLNLIINRFIVLEDFYSFKAGEVWSYFDSISMWHRYIQIPHSVKKSFKILLQHDVHELIDSAKIEPL